MRPRGDARRALRHALEAAGAQALTWRDLAAVASLGREQARRTLYNMATAGEAVRVKEVVRPGVNRPMVAFALAPQGGGRDAGAGRGMADALAALDGVTRCVWGSSR